MGLDWLEFRLAELEATATEDALSHREDGVGRPWSSLIPLR
jgi:hypothetical protein